MTEIESNEAAIRNRLATVEDRLLQVEKRLNMPPAAYSHKTRSQAFAN
jgi:hypothetical protein